MNYIERVKETERLAAMKTAAVNEMLLAAGRRDMVTYHEQRKKAESAVKRMKMIEGLS